MSYIYAIVNIINNKKYIGKTNFTIDKRLKEHFNEINRERVQKRPLYNAIKKYGKENFRIYQLEECLYTEVDIKETFWINIFNTYKEGYNATVGGDGKSFVDYDKVFELYNKGYTNKEISERLKIHTTTVRYILKNFGVATNRNTELKRGRGVYQIKDNEVINTFPSVHKAVKWLFQNKACKSESKGNNPHIRDAANKKQETAFGYTWKWI